MTKKKKAKKAEVKEQKKASSKSKSKRSVLSYIVGAIVVIIIIVALILLLRSCQAPTTAHVTPTQPAVQPTETTTQAPTAVSDKPGEIRYCTEEFAIGWPKNKLGQPCKIDGNKVTAQIMFSGKGTQIDGMWFYINTTSGKEEYMKDTRVVKQGDTVEYAIDVGEHIDSMVALPQSAEAGKACLNQRLLIIKAESCVAG